MKSSVGHVFCLFCLSLVITGCGGGGSGDPVPPKNPTPPPTDLKAANGGDNKDMATLPD